MNIGEFRINLRLGDKAYPVFCKREDESIYRKAATSFNNKYLKYRELNQELDEIDILRMTGFHFAFLWLQLRGSTSSLPEQSS